jgi:hypothetical protein
MAFYTDVALTVAGLPFFPIADAARSDGGYCPHSTCPAGEDLCFANELDLSSVK